jgi:antitoxin VapB
MLEGARVSADVREVRLFRNNRSQALRIPVDFELPSDRARLRKEGDRLIVEPVRRAGLLGLIGQWDSIDDELGGIADPPVAAESPLG